MNRPSLKRLLKPRELEDKTIPIAGDYRPIPSIAARAILGLLFDGTALLVVVGALFLLADLTGLEPHDGVLFWAGGVLYLGATAGRPGRRRGQTLGKQLFGLRVVRARDGGPIGAARAWARGAVVALFLPFAYPLWAIAIALGGDRVTDDNFGTAVGFAALGVTLLVGALNRRRQTLHDLLFATTVVETTIERGREPEELVGSGQLQAFAPRLKDPLDGPPVTVAVGRRRVRVRDGDTLLVAIFIYIQVNHAIELIR